MVMKRLCDFCGVDQKNANICYPAHHRIAAVGCNVELVVYHPKEAGTVLDVCRACTLKLTYDALRQDSTLHAAVLNDYETRAKE